MDCGYKGNVVLAALKCPAPPIFYLLLSSELPTHNTPKKKPGPWSDISLAKDVPSKAEGGVMIIISNITIYYM
jgi:hypothetical protein